MTVIANQNLYRKKKRPMETARRRKTQTWITQHIVNACANAHAPCDKRVFINVWNCNSQKKIRESEWKSSNSVTRPATARREREADVTEREREMKKCVHFFLFIHSVCHFNFSVPFHFTLIWKNKQRNYDFFLLPKKEIESERAVGFLWA